MKLKRNLESIIVLLLFIICIIGLKLFNSTTDYKDYQEITAQENKINYSIYVDNKKVGTIHDMKRFNAFLLEKFKNRMAANGGHLFFGDNVKILEDYANFSAKGDAIDEYEKIAEEAQFLMKGYRVKDLATQKSYNVSSEADWLEGIALIEDTISKVDAEHGASDKTVIATSIEVEPIMIDVQDVLSRDELIASIVNENNLAVEVQRSMPLQQVAEETGVSVEEIELLNPELSTDTVVLPNSSVQITDGSYKNKFTKLKILHEVEDVMYDIEYQDDDTEYTGVEKILQEGVMGKQEVEYTVKDLMSGERIVQNMQVKKIITAPQTQIVLRGTKEAPNVGTGEFIWPVTSRRVSTEFGLDYLFGNARQHNGLDINEGFGASISAIDNGVVLEEGFSSSYGYYVIIDHNNGYWSLYAHNQENLVHAGQIVPKGHVIGLMGSTGFSTGPHVHLEIRKGGNSKEFAVNPRDYIS